MILLEIGENEIVINNDYLQDYGTAKTYRFNFKYDNNEVDIDLSPEIVNDRYVQFTFNLTDDYSEIDTNTIILVKGTHYFTIYEGTDIIYKDFIFVKN